MAEGSEGGEAAVVSFDELMRAAGDVTQRIREQLSPRGVMKTWLGPSALLADAVAGSVLRCESSEDGAFAVVVPPKGPMSSLVKRFRGGVSVRVSRDGSLASVRYEDLQSLNGIVKGIVPGIITMGGFRGPLAGTVKLLTSGEAVAVTVYPSSPPGVHPRFVVTADRNEEVILESEDFSSVLSVLAVRAVPWAQFTAAEWWGLPAVMVAPTLISMQWSQGEDALGIATVFGLPAVASNIDVLQFLVGCCEPPPALTTVEELAHGMTDDVPAEVSAAVEALMLRLPAATQSRPSIVDSVHSRLRAILQSPDAPEPFVAFGRAWRQGALEPPSRRPSRTTSPSPSRPRRTVAASSPIGAQARPMSLEEEVAAMTPNTMRQKLVEALAGHRSGDTEGPNAGEPPAIASARPAAAARARHSGQLGGLFARGAGASTLPPALTTAADPLVCGSAAPARTSTTPDATTVPAPAPNPSHSARLIGDVLESISPEGGRGIATAVIVPEAYYHQPVTSVVRELVSHGMPDVVAQFAHAAGDTIPVTAGSGFEAVSLLRHIEEVFADVCDAAPSFSFLDRQPARDWGEAVEAVQVLLGRYSSTFRAKRHKAVPTVEPAAHAPSEEKPPAGSYKQVSTATASERPGACDAQLLEDMASAVVIRREHVRTSTFCSATSSPEERDKALHGELAHFHSTYGQAATAYILSNGTVHTPLSGYGVPMALAAIRSHLLARVTQLVHSTVGFERALTMHAKCSSLATSFLTGVMVVEDCVALLGGSAPHEDAEVRREGGATSTGTLGSTSGPNAQLSIREAFSLWGQGLHMVLGEIPGVPTSGTDFAVCAQMKKIPRELDETKLLSICRYMTSRVGVSLSAHRTLRGKPLPDVCAIIRTATTTVFQERDLDQRSEERAAAVMGPLLARVQQLEAAQAKAPATTERKTRWGAKVTASATSGKQTGKKGDPPVQQSATSTSSLSPAQEAAQQFLASLPAPSATPQPILAPSSQSAGGASSQASDGRITSRLKALLELSALYRQHVGMDPKGDPVQEPCAYYALFGECSQVDCARCSSNKSFPRQLVDAIKTRCDPKIFGPKQRGKQKSASGAEKKQSYK